MASPSESDPWAWQQWAAQQDPSLYGFQGGEIPIDQYNVGRIRDLLTQAGLWKPEYEASTGMPPWTSHGGQGNDTPAIDTSALNGYQWVTARGPNNMQLHELLDPSGNILSRAQDINQGSMKGADYAQALSVLGGGALSAAGGAAGLGQSLYGLSGTAGAAAGGATAGALGGAVNSGLTGGNVLTGALKGAAMGGIGGAAGSYLSGGSGIDPAASDYGYTNQMDAASDLYGQQMHLPAGFTDVNLPAGYDQAANWQPQQLDGTALQADQVSALNPAAGASPYDTIDINGNPGGRLSGMDMASDTPTDWSQINPQMQVPSGLTDMSGIKGTLDSLQTPSATLDQSGTLPDTLKNVLAGGSLAGGGGSLLDSLGNLNGSDLLKGGTLLAGALAGSQGTPASSTTSQSRTDPRFDPYLYGSGGLLQSAQDTYNANKTPNADMQAGWAAQRGLLSDPGIAAQLQQFRTQGAGGLLSAGIAANPFSTGAMQSRGGLPQTPSSGPVTASPMQGGQRNDLIQLPSIDRNDKAARYIPR